MLAQLAVDEGLTSRAMFLAIGPRLNRRVQAAFRCYANELIPDDDLADNRVRFQAITLENVINAIHQAGAVELAKKLWARYCDFERVFHLAMAEYTRADSSSMTPELATDGPSSPALGTKRSRARSLIRDKPEVASENQ
jgi:hypothetical protein